MSDLVVTVPMKLWWDWIREGDAVDEPYTGEEWGFYLYGPKPPIEAGERLYIAAHGRLRGYAPVSRLERSDRAWVICRRGGAVAVTVNRRIIGFRGWRLVDWQRGMEVSFPEWRTCDVPAKWIAAEVLNMLSEIYTSDEAKSFMSAPQPEFGDQSAWDLLAAGHAEQLLDGMRKVLAEDWETI